MNEPREIRHRRGYRGGLFFPLILIAIGAVFLLRNANILSGNAFDLFIRLWPILLIAMGLDSLFRRDSIVGPIFWTGVGVLLLLANLNLLAFDLWYILLHLWPVFLIAIGLDIMVGRRSILGGVVAVVLLAAILGGSLWYLNAGAPLVGQVLAGQAVSQPLNGATTASVNLKPAFVALRLGALNADTANLVEGSAVPSSGETIRSDYHLAGANGVFTLESQGVTIVFSPGRNRYSWDLKLNPSIPLGLQVDMGAGDLNLDLSGLKISGLKVNAGVGQSTIQLPEGGNFSAEIDQAIGQVIIVAPRGMALRVHVEGALSNVDAPSDFIRQDKDSSSPSYAGAESKIDLTISHAIGNVVVRYK